MENETNDIIFDPILGEWRTTDEYKKVVERIVETRGGSSPTKWGSITGNITNQTDLDDKFATKKDKTYLERYRGWNAAIAARHNIAARAVLVGDSITQLTGYVTAQKINSNFNADDDSRYIPVSSSIPTWGTWTGTYSTSYGLGGWAGILDPAEQGTLTQDCTGFILAYTVQKTGGSDLEIYIDNVLVDTISTTDAGISGTTESGRLWTSSVLNYGNHTLKVIGAGSGTAIVDGAFYSSGNGAENNHLNNVQVWNAGHTGWKCSNFNSTPGHFEALQTLDPGLIYVFLGTNDYADGLATFTTNFQTLLDTLETNHPDASFLLIAPYAAVDRSASGWSDFVAVIKNEADTRGMAYLDLFDIMGDVGNTYDIYGFSDDQVHTNTTGTEIMTNAIVDAMYPFGVHLKSPYVRQNGNTNLTGGLVSNAGNNGYIGFGVLFGYPIFVGQRVPTDASAEFWMLNSGIASLLGFPGFTAGWGAGSANPDVNISRPSANTLGIYGSSSAAWGDLLAGDITADTFNLRTKPDYTVTNATTDRSFDADSTTIDELADVLGTLISDLITAGLLQ